MQFRVFVVFGCLLSAGAAAVRSAEIPLEKTVASPVAPADSLNYLQSHPDVVVELVASEPQVIDPVAMAFDEFGRLWVVEMTDYPNGPAEGESAKSKIKILRDKDGDGYYETATLFKDGLLFANGVLPYKGGAIVTYSGEVAYLKDTDGDDRCDVHEVWFRGFAEENPQLRANHPTFGHDGWVYVSNGLRGGKVVPVKKEWAKDAEPLDLSRVDFRFHPETGAFEGITGTGQFGLSFDDFGNRFACSNRNPCMQVVLEQSDVAINPQVRISNLREDVSPAGELSRVYSITSAWTTSTLHAGQFTAACGVTIYRGNALGTEFYGNSFTCEPTGSLVHRDVLTPNGATFSSHYGRNEVEFLASRDSWFRPVNLAHGPDGALYVCDMYRAVIEHPQFMPDELKTRPDLTLGNDRGRIYRIRSKMRPATADTTDFSNASRDTLLKLLSHPNAWQREVAMRLLTERNDVESVEELIKLVGHDDPKVATAALWMIKRLKATIDEELISLVFASDEPALIEQLLRMEPTALAGSDRFAPTLVELSSTKHGALKFRLALVAGQVASNETANRMLTPLASGAGDDPWLQQAVLIAAHAQPGAILQGLIADLSSDNANARLEMIRKLSEQIGLRNRNEEVSAALSLLTVAPALDAATTDQVRLSLLGGLGEGLRLKGRNLTAALDGATPEAKSLANETVETASRIARDGKQPTALRLQCVEFLRHARSPESIAALQELAGGDAVIAVSQAAIEVWAALEPTNAAEALLDGFSAKTPALRGTILTVLVQNPASVPPLLDAVEQKRVAAAELSPIQRRILQRHNQPEIKPRVDKLLAASAAPDRAEVLKKYQPALTLTADPTRGREVFKKTCVACHRIGELGVNVAPDIADSRTAKPDVLLTNILDPNRAIDNNYFSYTVLLDSGKVLTGIIATETGNSITLKQPENKTVTILKDEIEEMKSDGVSLMPVGLEKNISVQEMADLISFIKNWRYLDGEVPIDVARPVSQ